MKNKEIWISFAVAGTALFVIVFSFAYLFFTVQENGLSMPTVDVPNESIIISTVMPTTATASISIPTQITIPTQIPPQVIASEDYAVFYVMQYGDRFAKLAELYGSTEADLRALNEVDYNDWFYAGSIVRIRPEAEGIPGSKFLMVSDAELINSPNAVGFDSAEFVNRQHGFLASYSENISGKEEGLILTGVEILEKVASDYSVNPRLLIAVIDYQTEWITNSNPAEHTLQGSFGLGNSSCETFYCQLSWVADRLNWGYYSWKKAEISHLRTQDGQLIKIDSSLNSGTVGLQNYAASYHDLNHWQKAVSQEGIYQVYTNFFGNPFLQSLSSSVPIGLTQPNWSLPFEIGKEWVFTGGPHPGWGRGAAYAALDFAPIDGYGCYASPEWVISISEGVVVRVDEGLVLVDVDGDGFEQTGWTIQYMHIANAQEAHQIGDKLNQGDKIGHPSCEGGYSTGTHVHIARLYQGEWMDAGDDVVPFVMDGWRASSENGQYDGYLIKDGIFLAPYQSGFSIDENYVISR